MEHVAYSQDVGDLWIACDLLVADLRDDGNVCFLDFRHESELLGVIFQTRPRSAWHPTPTPA